MQTLSEWVRNLVVLVFVISAAQLLLPTNTMRPYVRFVLGLVVIAVLLTSMFQLTSADIRLDLMLFPDGVSESARPYIEQGQMLAMEARANLVARDTGRMVSHVTSVATMVLGFEPEHVSVQLTRDAAIDFIAIVLPQSIDTAGVTGGNGPTVGGETGWGTETAERAALIIAGFVGVEPSQIQFQIGAYGRGGALRWKVVSVHGNVCSRVTGPKQCPETGCRGGDIRDGRAVSVLLFGPPADRQPGTKTDRRLSLPAVPGLPCWEIIKHSFCVTCFCCSRSVSS